MLTATSIEGQLAAVRDDPLRVLVVGAGVAGVTLAELLRRDGLHPVLVERSGPENGSGYMLAMMPLVDPALAALGLTEEYTARSVALRRYRICDRAGAPIRDYAMARLFSQFGDYRSISRGDLLHVLGSRGGAVTHGTTVTAVDQSPGAARVTLDDGSASVQAEFDLVVAADGLHSTTRGLVLDPTQVDTHDTGWGGWVTWTDLDRDDDLGEELWGAGLFIGSYPVKDRLGVIVCGPRADTRAGAAQFAEDARSALPARGPRIDQVLDAVERSDGGYYWSLTDCRCSTWSAGRVVLLGDAAAGFLPTAGIGACMAMESAGVLAPRLGATTPDRVPEALRSFERAQRPRVESAQDNSRQLARLMFRRSRLVAAARDTVTRFVPVGAALRPVRTLLETRPRVEASI